MEDAEVNSEYNEVAPHEADSQTPEQHQESQVDHREDLQEKNWRAARERIAALERESREKDELLRKALDIQERFSQPKHKEPEEPEEPDDEYINKGGVKKVTKKVVEPLEKKIEQLEATLAQQRQKELYQSLQKKYPDFDDVVNPESIALFEEREAELAATMIEIKDPYKMGIQAYKYIKALNINDDVPGRRRQREAEKKLDKNSKTVQSPQAFDKRPMAQAYRITEAEKSKLYEEMLGYASQASSVPYLQ